MKVQKLLVYDATWQALRISTLADNHSNGGWTTVAGTVDNLGTLKKYLDGSDQDFQERVWRILNMLAAVRMGYSGQQISGSEQDKLVEAALEGYRDLYDGPKVLSEAFDEDRFIDLLQLEYSLMIKQERSTFDLIYANLAKRLKRNKQSKHRQELRWCLSVLEQLREEHDEAR